MDQRNPQGTHTCPWCGLVSDASKLSCPACGATISAHAVVTESGWSELPGRKDMAKLQFGNSFCQIEGIYVPVADMNLAPGDSVYFAHHVLLWKDPQVVITTMGLKGACIPILRHVTFGTTTGAVTRGTTLSWEFRCGFGTAFCALDAVKYFVLPRLTRETRAKRIFIPLDQWLVLARVTM